MKVIYSTENARHCTFLKLVYRAITKDFWIDATEFMRQ